MLRTRRNTLALMVGLTTAACASSPQKQTANTPENPLLCTWPDGHSPGSISRMVGPSGGDLEILGNKVEIPGGALPQAAFVTLSQLQEDTVGVRVTVTRNGAPASFQRPIEVTVAYDEDRCPPNGGDRDGRIIWLTNAARSDFTPLPTKGVFWKKRVKATSPGNSDYVMAD